VHWVVIVFTLSNGCLLYSEDQTWHVQVQAGSVALPIKGDFELRVSEKLVSLESKDAAKNMYILPVSVIVPTPYERN